MVTIQILLRTWWFGSYPSSLTDFRLLQAGCADDEETRNKLLKQLLHQALEGPTSRLMVLDPRLMSQREMPPGNWSQLYLLYQAYCLASGSKCASKASFYSTSKAWRKTLRFRPVSKHSICQTCDRLKSSMRHSTNFVGHAQACDELLGHLSLMWRCRQVYWSARERARAREDLLAIIFDGFDKSKPSLPRWSRGQLPKNPVFERINRTGVAISASLAHGYGCVVFLAEEGISTGGEYSWECLLKTIQFCIDAAHRKGHRAPRSLWVQSDNTVKELKNSLSGAMCSHLVTSQFFEEAGHYHLPVGHTHEDVDGMFGLLSNHLQSARDLQTPQDMRRQAFYSFHSVSHHWDVSPFTYWIVHDESSWCLLARLAVHRTLLALSGWLRTRLARCLKKEVNFWKLWWWTGSLARNGNMSIKLRRVVSSCVQFYDLFHYHYASQVRPWKSLLPNVSSLDNAYRPRKDEDDRTPHSFTFRTRNSSLTEQLFQIVIL